MENPLEINLISFDVPFPPNYGGVIDVFYKIKALHDLGVNIHLHTFEYGRGQQKELKKYCSSVTYYRRKNFFSSFLSPLPFIVKSRHSEQLIKNLKKNNYPILFEGLHTTAALMDSEISNRKCYVRAHNIEHRYYLGLAKSEKKTFRQYFFQLESKKLKNYEKILNEVECIFTISPYEQTYFEKHFGKKATYLPVFYDEQHLSYQEPEYPFVLFHGDLRVSDNIKSALYHMKAFKKTDIPLCIASSFKNAEIDAEIEKNKNFSFHKIKDNNDLNNLFAKASVNCIYTYQKTGIKIKLLHTLTKGKHLVTNNLMVEDTGLTDLCTVAADKNELIEKVSKLLKTPFTEADYFNRITKLKDFRPTKNAEKLKNILDKS